MNIIQTETDDIKKILSQVFSWSKKQDFKGYNKHDGLNSPLLHRYFSWSKGARILAIQSVMRSPVNIRPILSTPKTINPKGLSLFVGGLLEQYKTTPSPEILAEAKKLLQILLNHRSVDKLASSSWGYPYPWQDLGFLAPTNTPNAVVTSFVCESFLEMYRLTDDSQYLQIVDEAINFFLHKLTVLEDTEEMLCLSYMPLPMSMRVMDVSILIGAVLAQYATLSNNQKLMTTAKRLVAFVIDKQTDYGAWYYTDPPQDSLISHDNYHTGFILDALWRYMEASEDWRWKINYEQGLKFYATELFNKDGSPRWMYDKDFPHDVHGAAQGLITFSLAVKNGYKYKDLIKNIASWSIANLYHQEGRFSYQQCRWGIKKFTLLRWCNAWMYKGLSSFLSTLDEVKN